MNQPIIRRSGADLVVEWTAIDSEGDGITSGLTVSCSIQRMSGSNFYWDSTATAFDDVAEPSLDSMAHVRDGLYSFTLTGGAENIERPYRVHLTITGDPDVDTDAVFSDVVRGIDYSMYPGGFVYYDQTGGSPGTELYVNGTIDNPVNSIANAKTLADLLCKKVSVRGTINTSVNLDGYYIKGLDGTATVNGIAPSFLGTFFENIQLTGQIPCDADTRFQKCLFDTLTVGSGAIMGTAIDPIFKGITEIGGAFKIINGSSLDSTAEIKFDNTAARLRIENYQGPLKITEMTDAAHTLDIHSDGDADITLDASNTNASAIATFIGIGTKVTTGAATTIIDSKWQELPIDLHEKYKDGRVYIGGPNASAGTVIGVNGTYDNPVDNDNDLKTIADQLGFQIGVIGSHTFDQDFSNYNIKGIDGDARIDGAPSNGSTPDFSGAFIQDVKLDGNIKCDADTKFLRCHFQSIFDSDTDLLGTAEDCIFEGLNKIGAGTFRIKNGSSFDDTTVFEYDGATAAMLIDNYEGKFSITDMTLAAHDFKIYSDGAADITMDATNTNASATAEFVGIGTKVTTGAATTITDDNWLELSTQAAADLHAKYKNGFVYAESGGSGTSVLGTDGTYDNPVSTLALAKTLADQLDKKIFIKSSFIGQAINLADYQIEGLALDNSTGIILEGDGVTGITLTNGSVRNLVLAGDIIVQNGFTAYDCEINGIDNDVSGAGLKGTFYNCKFTGTIKHVGKVHIHQGFSPFSGSGGNASFDSQDDDAEIHVYGWAGEAKFINQDGAGSPITEVFADEKAQIEFDASNTSGTITWKGFTPAVLTATSTLNDLNNSGGSDVNVTQWNGSAVAAPNVAGVPVIDVEYWQGNLTTGDGDWAELQSDVDQLLIDLAVLDQNVDDIEADTADMQPKLGTPAADISADIAAVKVDTAAIKLKTDNLPEAIKKNTAITRFPFHMVLSADPNSPATGLTVSAERSIDGGAFVSTTNAPVEVSNGMYYVDLSAADTNGTFITYRFSAATARDTKLSFKTTL